MKYVQCGTTAVIQEFYTTFIPLVQYSQHWTSIMEIYISGRSTQITACHSLCNLFILKMSCILFNEYIAVCDYRRQECNIQLHIPQTKYTFHSLKKRQMQDIFRMDKLQSEQPAVIYVLQPYCKFRHWLYCMGEMKVMSIKAEFHPCKSQQLQKV